MSDNEDDEVQNNEEEEENNAVMEGNDEDEDDVVQDDDDDDEIVDDNDDDEDDNAKPTARPTQRTRSIPCPLWWFPSASSRSTTACLRTLRPPCSHSWGSSRRRR